MSEMYRDYIKSLETLYSSYATPDKNAKRRKNTYQSDIRSEFSRDSDRIIHSHAFTRYIDKTQVFYFVKNDHITHRSLHVQIVSKIARTIGRALHLNEDLIEAISLGHDIGHPPYGHTGEKELSLLCQKHNIGNFMHNVQSVRLLDNIEDTDLTIQVLDGILSHNGEVNDRCLKPRVYDNWDEFDKKIRQAERNCHIYPMTAEGCIVRLADTIAYIGRDIQDAKEVGLIDDNIEYPQNSSEVLGNSNRDIVNSLIMNLLQNSDPEKGVFSYSKDAFEALSALKEFNYKNIYENPKLTCQKGKIANMYSVLFEQYLDDLNNNNQNSPVYQHFLKADYLKRKHSYLKEESPEKIVCDFISGMTDNYFEKRFCDLVLPTQTDGKFI